MSRHTTASPPLEDQGARDRITWDLDATLFVEAGAGSGKTRSLVQRIVALVTAGTPMRHIAAITFTEKAAAELRDRIRRAFETELAGNPEDPSVIPRLHAALEQVDAAAISTLHAFAQRILGENPIEAELPPNVEVLDEVASEVEFDQRWVRFRDRLLDDPDLERWLLLAFAAGVGLEDLHRLAKVFQDSWDLIRAQDRIPPAKPQPPAVDVTGLVARLEELLERRVECVDGGDRLCALLTDEVEPYLQRLREAPDELELLQILRQDKPRLEWASSGPGSKKSWADKGSVIAQLCAAGAHKRELADRVAQECLRRVAAEVRRFTLDAADQRRASGRLEFHDLLVLARDLLRGPHGRDVRARLAQRYQRLLLDEFQDTDPIQIDLATLIASEDPDAADRPWQDIRVEPGRLFFVGDPKQSIYRFRRADIDLFLSAREVFGERLALSTNFRTTPPVIGWINHVFARLIEAAPGSQPPYQPLDPAPARTVPPRGAPVTVLGVEPQEGDLNAAALREREAADVADAVQAALGWQVSRPDPAGGERWRDATLGDVTILLPARTSLPALERALDRAGLPYRAETSSLVYSTREVRDLMAAVRAVADPADQLALVTALRSPVFGCGDDDLADYKVGHGGVWNVLAEPPKDLDARHPVVDAMAYLRSLHQELAWLAPSEVLDRIARDRRLFELGYALGRPRDLWRRLRFVIDQARAWSESEAGTLREYLEWARMQASERARVAETVLPETDDDAVRIMTIHGSKGLEFPITIVSGMTTASRAATARVEVAFPPQRRVAIKVGKDIVSPEFENFRPIDEQMGFHERLRLLYVACTRAQDHLVVSLHRKERNLPPEPRKRTNAELVAGACEGLELAWLPPVAEAPRPAPAPAAPAPLPALGDWEAQRAAKLATSGRHRTLGASDVALLADDAHADQDGEVAAGAAKQPRDLELPPWQKGRYGTAVGRAVHAVLQTIDLATGQGLEAAAAAQAAAEGAIGREGDIRQLAGAALAAPAVREAVRCPRWRETYVAAPLKARTLEGYIDLLYRTADGLVIVDYKTSSSTADLDRRLDAYRAQGGAYAVAVERAVAEPVARVVFVFLTPDGAVELDLPDLARAREEVLAVLDDGPTETVSTTVSTKGEG